MARCRRRLADPGALPPRGPAWYLISFVIYEDSSRRPGLSAGSVPSVGVAAWAVVTLLVGCALGACTSESAVNKERCLAPVVGEGTAVARVGAVPITLEQLAARIEAQGGAAVRRYGQPDALRQYVEDQVRFELLAQAALARGLARDPDVVDVARKAMVRKLLEKDLGAGVIAHSVSDVEIARYYDRHIDEYMQPAMVRLGHVQLPPTEAGRALAKTMIDELAGQTELLDVAIARLADKHSTDVTSRKSSGMLPFMTREEIQREFGLSFADVAFSGQAGQVAAEPAQSTRGWHVVLVAARREGLARPLDEVRDGIRDKLLKGQRSEEFQSYLDEIRQRFPVALYEESLSVLQQRLAAGASKETP